MPLHEKKVIAVLPAYNAEKTLQATFDDIPKDWVEEVRRRVQAGREFQDAVREVLAANAQLLMLERKKPKKKKEM